MATYILVHGSWHGAWCWEKIIPLLEKENHRVIAPDLPAHGKDLTPLKEVTFQSYINCLSHILDSINEKVILVGHSMGGMVISAVAQQYSHKIAKLVYLAGFLPQDGESLVSLAQKQPPTEISQAIKSNKEENTIIFPLHHMKAFAYQQCSDDLVSILLPRFCLEPFLPWITPVKIDSAIFSKISKVYIECTEDNAITLISQRRMERSTPCITYTLHTDHSPFYSDPVGLANILLLISE